MCKPSATKFVLCNSYLLCFGPFPYADLSSSSTQVAQECIPGSFAKIVTIAVHVLQSILMPGSSQLSGPVAYDGNDVRFVAENENVAFPCSKGSLYIARDEIEERSPSKKDGIDSSKEYELRKLYCTFLKDLGIKLRMPHVVIATSTVFSHRFFLYQSHRKNDCYTIATACMFLAGKVEEARRALEEVVLVSYCLQNKNNPMAAQEFKEKEICERQKELVLLAEHMVLVTLDFELKVRHPHSFVLLAASKFKFDCEALVPVSYIILNDSLYTTLCLQFEPLHIAVSAMLLAAKLLKYKFPFKSWWKQFNVTQNQLKEICNQVLELYERERVSSSIVQSGSSSSSVDDKANFLADCPLTIPASNLQGHGTPKEHPMYNSGAFTSNSSLTRITNPKSSLPKRPSSVSMATTKPKLGFKDIPKASAKEVELTFWEPEAPSRKKRPTEDNTDVQHANRPKLAAIPKKGSKGVPTRSK
ncbi:hypothetical protein GOP47_0022432 [Adiantum capillus-veneris]|uniref:Cyclin-like domain-containing protein n=1 Tax=Adiantum capillus-veneris TaxID=13818 RepID=A0A9D4U6H6_ADICA|nr:hypothetical protein GOP47_0022432 [Adiantum capillus-veneris]